MSTKKLQILDSLIQTPVKMEILETICEDITLEYASGGATYTFPSEITLDENGLYYLDYKYYKNGVFDEINSYTGFSKVVDSVVSWFSSPTVTNGLILNTTGITDTWLSSGATPIFSIYKVSIEITDEMLYDALNREGFGNIASGYASHAEGEGAIASGEASHAEGSSKASGSNSHAEGSSKASGSNSHAEGSSKASGSNSHAEGSNTTASGTYSHSEGRQTTASGYASHAEGGGRYRFW